MRSLVTLLLFVSLQSAAQRVLPPDVVFEELFVDVQMSRIFPDNKTFVDCIPKRSPEAILADYRAIKANPNLRFSLKLFVEENFTIPSAPATSFKSSEKNIVAHITNLWKVLKREGDSTVAGASLLPLPYPYIVPGGRFREIYYWDSYFTMLGLKESKEYGMMEAMVNNFAYLIDSFGHIPNGNRSYYLSRSQPPYFSLMVDLLASVKGNAVYMRYLPQLEREWQYWNSESKRRSTGNGSFLYYYNDATPRPRQESFYEDSVLLLEVHQKRQQQSGKEASSPGSEGAVSILRNVLPGQLYRNLRSAAESGWDFSSRWFVGGNSLHYIQTTAIAPVDLNCLVLHLGQTLSKAYLLAGKKEAYQQLNTALASVSKQMPAFFESKKGWFTDRMYNQQSLSSPTPNNEYTLAGMYPLFFKLATKEQAAAAVQFLKKNFLKGGGVVTTLNNTGQQWDAPNGWAPLQWVTIIGLENYGYSDLAKEIARRWVGLNKKVFLKTGKLMEKYNVVNLDLEGGGGEYPSQDGFGWTNGVLLSLIKKYKLN